MFRNIKRLFCRSSLTVAIDCENISYRRLTAMVDTVLRMRYDSVHYQCFLNPNHPGSNNWTIAAKELLTANNGHTVEFIHHACKWSKKSSQDVSLAVRIMDQYHKRSLGDFALVSGDKDFEPLVDHVGVDRRTFIINPECLPAVGDESPTSAENASNSIDTKNKPAVDAIVRMLSKDARTGVLLPQVGDYLNRKNIEYFGTLSKVIKNSSELSLTDDLVSLSDEQA